jgi:hypothetical protein
MRVIFNLCWFSTPNTSTLCCFEVFNGAPEMFTDIYKTKSNRRTWLTSRIKNKLFSVISCLPNSHMHFYNSVLMLWTAFLWLSIAIGGVMLWTGCWIFVCHQWRRVSWHPQVYPVKGKLKYPSPTQEVTRERRTVSYQH